MNPAPANSLIVLIIDDTPMVIAALSRILLPHYSVKVAKDGEEGLKLAERHKTDLIILDINMPGLSGFAVLSELKEREKTRDVPVILITGSEDVEDKAQGLHLGAVEYIKKPFSEETILRKVEKHIGG